MSVRPGVFMYYLFEGEKYLAEILDILPNNKSLILLRNFEKINNSENEYHVISCVCDVDIDELIPIKSK